MQDQHRAVSPCEFKYQNFWYFVPRMLALFRSLTMSLTLFLASSGSLAVLAGAEPRAAWRCGSFSGQTKPGSQSLTRMISKTSLNRGARVVKGASAPRAGHGLWGFLWVLVWAAGQALRAGIPGFAHSPAGK